jgi:hypothetical protein
MVLSWIINSVSKEIAANVISVDSAEVMWNDLRDPFSQQNRPRIYQIQKAISAMSQEDQSVSSYFTALKGLWDELLIYHPLPICIYGKCSYGVLKTLTDYHHQEYVLQFLMGLNKSFSHVKCQILLMDPLPPINKVFSLVVQHEHQKEISGSFSSMSQNTDALLAKTPSPSQSTYSRPTDGNPSRFDKSSFALKDRPTCSHCGLHGHTMEKCYHLHNSPPSFKFTKGKNAVDSQSANQVSESESPFVTLPIIQEQIQQLFAMLKPHSEGVSLVNQVSSPQTHLVPHMSGKILTSSNLSQFPQHFSFSSIYSFQVASQLVNHSWIIDTGTTDHMVYSISFLTTITTTIF